MLFLSLIGSPSQRKLGLVFYKHINKFDKNCKNDRIAYMKRLSMIIVNLFVSIIIALSFWGVNYLLLSWNNTIGLILFIILNLFLAKIVTKRNFILSNFIGIGFMAIIILTFDWLPISFDIPFLFLTLISSIFVYPIYTRKRLNLK